MTRKMTSAMILMVLLSLAVAGVAQAQTEAAIAVTRSDLQADRQAVIAANLPMTEVESAAFWPIYRAYRAEIAVIGDKMVAIISAYAKAYNEQAMTDEQGTTWTKEVLKLKKDALGVRESYLGKFGKVLPGKSVACFYQIENKLDAAVDVSIAAEVPLVEVK